MNKINLEHITEHAHEAFLRRAALVDLPFMLKGSYVFRQYLEDKSIRKAMDLDFMYIGGPINVNEAEQIFSDWMIEVSEIQLNDGFVFQSFRENRFWRMIDYAMDDDFPTVNTDLAYNVIAAPDYKDEINIDITFNLPLEDKAVPLDYVPKQGPQFTIPLTCPLSLQVAYKLHQTIVRPRKKDIVDLIFLMKHPRFDEEAFEKMLQALVNECAKDKVNVYYLKWYITDAAERSAKKQSLSKNEKRLKEKITPFYPYDNYLPYTEDAAVPRTDVALFRQFRSAFIHAGFDEWTLGNLPKPQGGY